MTFRSVSIDLPKQLLNPVLRSTIAQYAANAGPRASRSENAVIRNLGESMSCDIGLRSSIGHYRRDRLANHMPNCTILDQHKHHGSSLR